MSLPMTVPRSPWALVTRPIVWAVVFAVSVTVVGVGGSVGNAHSPVRGDSVASRPPPPPSPLSIQSFSVTPRADDVGLPATILVNVTGGSPPYAFQWSGLPANCPGSDVAQVVCAPNASGEFPVAVTVTDATNASVASSLDLSVAPALAIENLTIAPSVVPALGTLVIAVDRVGGTAPFRYAYSGLPPGCAGANASAIECRPNATGTYTVSVGVADSLGANVEKNGTVSVGSAGPGPTVTGFEAIPANLTLGGSTTFAVQVDGGVAPLTFTYAGLPAGCTPVDSSALPCTPNATGVFSVNVTVQDAIGQTAHATTDLVVVPVPPSPLALLGFAVYPPDVAVGNFTVFALLATGGVTPLVYAYSGLPEGCFSVSLPVLLCRPAGAGVFTVDVTVTDAAGHEMSSSATLLVTGTPAPAAAASPDPGPTYALLLGVGMLVGAAATWTLLWVLRRRYRL